MATQEPHWLKDQDVITVELPWSEVCMAMGIAGQVRPVRLIWPDEQSAVATAQILNDDGTPYSFPVLAGEAGLYCQRYTYGTLRARTYPAGRWYGYPAGPPCGITNCVLHGRQEVNG